MNSDIESKTLAKHSQFRQGYDIVVKYCKPGSPQLHVVGVSQKMKRLQVT